MPEGDTLHRAANMLSPLLLGQQVKALELPRRDEHVPSVIGKKVTRVYARGKNLLIHFEGGVVLHTHLKMNGVWRGYAPSEARPKVGGQVVVKLDVESGASAYCFSAPIVRLLREAALAHDERIASLGPDPISPDFDLEFSFRRLRSAATMPIGEALLDQRLVAGIGNVWKSELLFEHRLDPFAPVSAFTDEELTRVLKSAMHGLRRGALTGSRPSRIYGRSGKPCVRCGRSIRMKRQGELGRSTYFCIECQPSRV